VVLLQVNFLNFFGLFKKFFNPLMLLIIYITLIYGLRLSLICSIVGGFLLGLYSLLNFGLIMISLIICTLVVNYLFNKLFTNRSLYSLNLLVIFGTIVYNLSLFVINWFLFIFNSSTFFISINYIYIYHLIIQIALSCLVVTLIYILFNYLTQRLKKTFLIKENF